MNKLYKSLLLLSTLSPVLIASSCNKNIEKPIENEKNDKENIFKEVKDTDPIWTAFSIDLNTSQINKFFPNEKLHPIKNYKLMTDVKEVLFDFFNTITDKNYVSDNIIKNVEQEYLAFLGIYSNFLNESRNYRLIKNFETSDANSNSIRNIDNFNFLEALNKNLSESSNFESKNTRVFKSRIAENIVETTEFSNLFNQWIDFNVKNERVPNEFPPSDIELIDHGGNSQSRDNNVDNKKEKTKGTIRDEHYTNHIPEKIDYKAAIKTRNYKQLFNNYQLFAIDDIQIKDKIMPDGSASKILTFKYNKAYKDAFKNNEITIKAEKYKEYSDYQENITNGRNYKITIYHRPKLMDFKKFIEWQKNTLFYAKRPEPETDYYSISLDDLFKAYRIDPKWHGNIIQVKSLTYWKNFHNFFFPKEMGYYEESYKQIRSIWNPNGTIIWDPYKTFYDMRKSNYQDMWTILDQPSSFNLEKLDPNIRIDDETFRKI